MKKPHPFEVITQKHGPLRNLNDVIEEHTTFGQQAADWVAKSVGSWTFIVGQIILLAIWVVLNVTAWIHHWDPYPFILMNLVLSMQAAFTAPIIMMSQNRQTERDRLEAHNDFLINQKAEEEVRAILTHLMHNEQQLSELRESIAALRVQLGENGREHSDPAPDERDS